MNNDWIDVAAADQVPDGDVIAVAPEHTAGRDIALVRLGDEVFAIDATCTHGSASFAAALWKTTAASNARCTRAALTSGAAVRWVRR